MKQPWLFAGFAVVLVAVAGVSFFLGKQQAVIESLHTPTPTLPVDTSTTAPLTSQPTQTLVQTTPQPSPAPTTKGRTRSELKDQLMAIVKSKNYAALAGYMVDKPLVRLENSGCCGIITQAEAIAQMQYLNNAAGTWDFAETNPTVVALAAASPDYYGGNAIVGVSTDKYAVGFQVDATNTVTSISMTPNYDLLLP